MSTVDHSTTADLTPRQPAVKVTVYHNSEARFMPYEDGHLLTAVTCHWLDTPTDGATVADWVFRTFNADLDLLESERHLPGGETTFLAACVYRLLGHRSVSVGDVVAIETESPTAWLACDPFGWRRITEPAHRSGDPLSAESVYAHLANQRPFPRCDASLHPSGGSRA